MRTGSSAKSRGGGGAVHLGHELWGTIDGRILLFPSFRGRVWIGSFGD